MQAAHCMTNPWVSIRRDQLILVNKGVNEKEQLEKGLEEEEGKKAETAQLWLYRMHSDVIVHFIRLEFELGELQILME
jgi:hypothetical protein